VTKKSRRGLSIKHQKGNAVAGRRPDAAHSKGGKVVDRVTIKCLGHYFPSAAKGKKETESAIIAQDSQRRR